MCSITVNIQVCGASLFAECTFGGTVWTIAFKKCSRNNRHHCKYCSHGAEKLAEKAFLCTHSHHDQNQQNCSHKISSFRQLSCSNHGKYIPGAHSLKAGIKTGHTGKKQKCQDQVFYLLKSVYPFSGYPCLFFLPKNLARTNAVSSYSASPKVPNAQAYPQK